MFRVAAAKAGQTPELAQTIKDASPAKALQAAQLLLDKTGKEKPRGPEGLEPGPKLN